VVNVSRAGSAPAGLARPVLEEVTAGGAEPARRRFKYRQEAVLVVVLALMVVVFGVWNGHFLSRSNLISTAQDATEVGLLAIGELYVVVTAGIDLSVGAVLGLAGVVGALVGEKLADAALALVVAGLVSIVVGLVCGLANGAMIVRIRMSPFVATLAMLGIATGITLVLTSGVDVTGMPALAATVGNTVFGTILTMPILVTLVLAIALGLFLHKSVFGRWTYAVGSNALAARESGIDVRRHLLKIYSLSGVMAGVAGFVVMTRLGVASPIEGANDNLNAIVAVVIGGASLFGGRGSMLGTIIGAVMLSVILSGLIIVGVQPYWQTVVTGLLLAFSVAVQTIGAKGGREEAL
jgi:ribose transport system permease protein